MECFILFSEKIRKIKFDVSSGAIQVALNALDLLRSFSKNNKSETCNEFVEDFSELGRELFLIRPNMASVQNLVAQIVFEVNNLEEDDLFEVQKFAASRIEELSDQSVTAIIKSAEWATTLIDDSDFIATCSHSSTICRTFELAKQQGKNFTVMIAESRSADGKFHYGRVLASFLESLKIPVEVFLDKNIYMHVPKTNCVLVGADSLLVDGSVINGSPTYGVAVEAEDSGIPFYSVCETSKVNTLSYLGKNIEAKKGFDLVPANLITGVVSEKGILSIDRLVEIMEEKSKFYKIFNIK
jgi:translation initiation factor 2B subunit (eIF-2B alpha/beta/delta family)